MDGIKIEHQAASIETTTITAKCAWNSKPATSSKAATLARPDPNFRYGDHVAAASAPSSNFQARASSSTQGSHTLFFYCSDKKSFENISPGRLEGYKYHSLAADDSGTTLLEKLQEFVQSGIRVNELIILTHGDETGTLLVDSDKADPAPIEDIAAIGNLLAENATIYLFSCHSAGYENGATYSDYEIDSAGRSTKKLVKTQYDGNKTGDYLVQVAAATRRSVVGLTGYSHAEPMPSEKGMIQLHSRESREAGDRTPGGYYYYASRPSTYLPAQRARKMNSLTGRNKSNSTLNDLRKIVHSYQKEEMEAEAVAAAAAAAAAAELNMMEE